MNITIAKRQFALFPPLAFNYFLYSVVGLLLLCFVCDEFVLPYLEDHGKICSHSWHVENERLLNQLRKRNWANQENPVWRSEGLQVQEQCPKSKRILVMGDSFVWGSGYANVNTLWWRQLQRELQRRGYNDVEVIAAGLAGASTRMQLDWAKKLVPKYKPDAIVWGYVTNDPDEGSDKAGLGIVKTVKLPENDIPARPKSLFTDMYPNLADVLFDGMRKNNLVFKLSGEKNGFDFANWELQLLKGKNWQEYSKTVANLGSYVNSVGVPSFVITLPCCVYATNKPLNGSNVIEKIQTYYLARYPSVQALFSQHHIEWHDCLGAFCNSAKEDKRFLSDEPALWLGINPANGHPGPFGTYVHAVQAADILERKYPDVLGPKSLPVETAKVFVNDWTPESIYLRQNPDHIFIDYPNENEETLTMPLRKPFVSLNFQTPSNIKAISLNGPCLQNAEIWYTAEDPVKHFDDGTLIALGEKRGSSITWNVPATPQSTHMYTLRIHANFNGPNRKMLVDVVSNNK